MHMQTLSSSFQPVPEVHHSLHQMSIGDITLEFCITNLMQGTIIHHSFHSAKMPKYNMQHMLALLQSKQGQLLLFTRTKSVKLPSSCKVYLSGVSIAGFASTVVQS